MTTDHDFDLTFRRLGRRPARGGGIWVRGAIDGTHAFDALVLPEHAESESYELGRSRIARLLVQRLADRKVVFNFDRGLDVAAASSEAQAMVDFLAAGLADAVFA